jgi:2-keto-3-deoxy-L-rhamnonate aldolase RhmA
MKSGREQGSQGMQKGLKAMTRSRNLKIGHFIVEFATPGIGHIMKSAGCEFALFDLEHSGFGFETVKSAIRYLEAGEVSAIVRVPSKEYHHIARACDMGAEGLMVPMVGTAAEAQAIVDCLKYYPSGKRGVALQVAHDRYRVGAVAQKLAHANETTTLFCQIETAEGVANADAIAAIEHVDCLWVGHFDLSVSLGIPGQFDHKDFRKAIDKVITATSKRKKALGRLVPTVEQGVNFFSQGFDFICYSGDVWVLHNALAEAISALRAKCKSKGK